MKHRMAFLWVSVAAFMAEANVGVLTAQNARFKSTPVGTDEESFQ